MRKIMARNNKRREGYIQKSNAVCVVAYDLNGKPIPDDVATKIVNAVFQVTQNERLAINFTRT